MHVTSPLILENSLWQSDVSSDGQDNQNVAYTKTYTSPEPNHQMYRHILPMDSLILHCMMESSVMTMLDHTPRLYQINYTSLCSKRPANMVTSSTNNQS